MRLNRLHVHHLLSVYNYRLNQWLHALVDSADKKEQGEIGRLFHVLLIFVLCEARVARPLDDHALPKFCFLRSGTYNQEHVPCLETEPL